MKIKSINVVNYRNIDGNSMVLHPESNYLIGENNLGKSNFLFLLDTVCNGKSFDEKDFKNPDMPIEVVLELQLLPNELGFFGDNFSPEDPTAIKLRYTQKIDEGYATCVSYDTGETIQTKQLKKIHYIKYDTNALPSKELRIDTQKGAGLLVGNIIDRYVEENADEESFLNSERIENLREHINERLNKIKSFKDYSIKATIASTPNEMLSKLFFLSDGDRKIESTGSGVQFIAMATINVLCQIMNIYKSKSVNFEEHLYTDDNGKKILPIILSVDEPEVHLHPFLQRSLIRYYKRILQNKDNDFIELLRMCFGIDGLDGQLVIVTHSTDALVGDYRNLIRFYLDEEKTNIISGVALNLKYANEKHLLMHFPEIKEAFYSKCVILIEGETEYGCIHSFAETLNVSLDDLGICIINAGGEGSIKPLKYLLNSFSIPSVSIYDGDVKGGRTPADDEFFTNELCFEIEVVKHLYTLNQTSIIKQIVCDLDSKGENVVLDVDFVKKPFEKMKLDISAYIPKKLSDILESDATEFCNMYATWYIKKKGVLLGRIIGQILEPEHIPPCYVDAIRKAEEVAKNA